MAALLVQEGLAEVVLLVVGMVAVTHTNSEGSSSFEEVTRLFTESKFDPFVVGAKGNDS